ncbi:MAG: GNAT family N-acetyltransferase [Saprospiraceae bacterium]
MITYQFSDQITIDWLVKKMSQFLFPDLSKQQTRIKKPFIGVLAIQNRQPIGLILASSESTQTIYRIHSFLVHPSFRQQKIGSHLVQQLEQHIQQRGGKKVEGMYRSHWKSVLFIQQILQQQGWTEPKAKLIMANGKAADALAYFGKSSPLFNTFTFLSFTQMENSDLEFIQQKQTSTQWFAPELHPLTAQSTIHPACSFLLKKEKEIIGWIVSHHLQADLNEITAFFIDKKYSSYKLAYRMIQLVLTKQLALGIPKFLATSKMDGNPVAKLIERGGKVTDVFCTKGVYSSKQLKY